jgi:hypothetical protein
MALPESVRVKLSSEAAGAISITPVVVQDMPLHDLVEHLLAVAGKDHARIREMLMRGSLVSAGSRFRWAGWEPSGEDIAAVLATFPDADPSLPFDAARCVRAVLRGGRAPLELLREPPGGKRLGSLWGALMESAASERPAYAGYSYRERADYYRHEFRAADVPRLQAAAETVKYPTLREQIRTGGFSFAEFYVPR